jgi:hypothetical protein
MQTTFTVYKHSERNNYSLNAAKFVGNNQDWDQFLTDTNQLEKLMRLRKMSSRKRSPKIWRLRKTQEFIKWSNEHQVVTMYLPYAKVTVPNYDGRIPELSIKNAVLTALKTNSKEAFYYPKLNTNKPAHLHQVYYFNFYIEKL